MSEYELIIKKLEIVRDSEDEGMYLCDKKHSKILLEGIDKYKQVIDKIKEEIDMLNVVDCNIPNYIICITKINKILEEIE